MLRASLQSSGYEVTQASNGLEGFDRFQKDQPDVVITDLAMPEMDGVQLTEAIRRVAQTPIIVLSVRDADIMKVHALDAGADDYLTKPFSMPELLARVRVQLRKNAPDDLPEARLVAGDLTIDSATRRVTVGATEIHLTPKEFDLLFLLASHPNRVLTHKYLLRSIWGTAGDDQPEYLRVLIAHLRKKVEPEGLPRYIVSEPWVGYRFDPQGLEKVTSS